MCVLKEIASEKWLSVSDICVFDCNREEPGPGYMPMRPSEKERSSQSGRKSHSSHYTFQPQADCSAYRSLICVNALVGFTENQPVLFN